MASEATLACPREPGKDYSNPSLSPSPSRLVVRRRPCPQGSTFTPSSTCSAIVYRRLKRRLGHTLRGLHCKRRVVRTRKPPTHQLFGVESSPAGSQEFRASLQESNCSDSNGQRNCGFLHQQGGRYEIRLSLCPPLETCFMVSSQRDSSAGSTHPGSLECDSRQTIQTQSSDTDRVVPVSTGFQSLVLQMGPSSGRPVCDLHRDLVTQPVNGLCHRNLSNLNLHAWLLEPLPSRNKVSRMKWQQELRLLRKVQPEPFTNQSGPFLSNGVSRTR